jgi:hypothetical protein
MTTRARYLASYHASVGAITNTSQTFSTAQIGAVTTLTDGANISTDLAVNNNFQVTLGGNRTLDNPTNPGVSQTGSIFIVQDGTGSRTLSFGTNWKFAGGTGPTLSTAASAVDRLDYVVKTATEVQSVVTLDIKTIA